MQGKGEDHHDREPELRYRNTDKRYDLDLIIDIGISFERRQGAHGNGDQHRQDHAGDREIGGRGNAVEQFQADVPPGDQGFSEVALSGSPDPFSVLYV